METYYYSDDNTLQIATMFLSLAWSFTCPLVVKKLQSQVLLPAGAGRVPHESPMLEVSVVKCSCQW